MTQPIDPTAGRKPMTLPPGEDKAKTRPAPQAEAHATDRVSLGKGEQAEKTYGPGLKVAEPYELLRQLVIKTLMDQGVATGIEVEGGTIDLETLTPEEAQALIAEDGYFGVEQTSQRIVDFAINAFGGDPAKLQQMKDSIDKGFSAAQEAFGGALPEISQQTYTAIMDKLDQFAASSEPAE